MRIFLTAFALLLFVALHAQKKNSKSTDLTAKFDSYISSSMPLWKVPGLSVAVVKDGKIVFTKGYGVAEKGKAEPFTSSTLAICASTTKAMTAVCMAMLVDEGKVHWNDKVSDVYPALKLKDPEATAQITVKDLFTHNTGLGNADLLWVLRYPTDSIIYRMRQVEPAYSLRSSFIYQNLMYIVAGEVIHHLTGKTWEDFITERLFGPLGMQHTKALASRLATTEKKITPHVLYPDSVVRPIVYPPYEVGAAGGVWSNAEDISKWMLFLLDSTKLNGKPLLKAETYAELFSPQVIGEPYPTTAVVRHHWDTYGLGWFQHDFKGKMLQYHTGSLDGATAIIGLVPEEHFGVYVFGNLDHAELRHALLYKAVDLWCFNDDSRDYSKEFFSLYSGLHAVTKAKEVKEDSSRATGTHPSLQLKDYTGNFGNEIYGPATVVLEKDSLHIKVPGELRFTLSHWQYDSFRAMPQYDWWTPVPVQFTINQMGKVSQFSFDGIVYKKKGE